MPTSVRSFCKINLGLAVGPPRKDGFHQLATCYQTLSLHDRVRVTAHPASRTRVTLTANHPGVPRTETGDAERNTAVRMVAAALERMRLTAEVEIEIEKRLPVQGGLGAGSANAAAALLGLERELGHSLDGVARLDLAADVGSDVPLFLLGGTVLGLGRGEEVYPLPDLPEMSCVVAIPQVGVSTARAFRALDERVPEDWVPEERVPEDTGLPRLTPGTAPDRLRQLSRALAAVWMTRGAATEVLAAKSARSLKPGFTGIAHPLRPEHSSGDSPQGAATRDERQGNGDLAENLLLALVRTGIENDFEEVVFSEHPSLRSTKRDLMGSGPGTTGGALYAALSGSGSALFGLYLTQADAVAAQRRVQTAGTRAIVTKTISRPEYWRTMFARERVEFAE